jgi:lantibiotic modifying enzyme
MPNFSHGTAGIAFFLAAAGMETGRSEFIDAALGGGRHLQAIARTDGGICLVPHRDPPSDEFDGPNGEPSYALSWCHGPSGTGALWWQLYLATRDEAFVDWLGRSAKALVPGAIPPTVWGVPRNEPPGEWPSVCYCHGSAGDADFLLNVCRVTGLEYLRPVALHMLDDCLSRAIPDADGLKWMQLGPVGWDAEADKPLADWHPQTGFSLGAAGIGYALLGADGFLAGRQRRIVLPDSPFASQTAR